MEPELAFVIEFIRRLRLLSQWMGIPHMHCDHRGNWQIETLSPPGITFFDSNGEQPKEWL